MRIFIVMVVWLNYIVSTSDICVIRVRFMLSDIMWCEHLRFLLYIHGAAEVGDLRYG